MKEVDDSESQEPRVSYVKARSQALRLIKFRPRSEAELKKRLQLKGFGPSIIEPLLAELKRIMLIDDATFSRYLVTGKMLSKPMGKRGLLRTLTAKGVDPCVGVRAVEQAWKESDELTVARCLARGRMSHLEGLSSEARERRLFGFLSRRGFSSDVVYKVVREFSHAVS